MELSNKFRIKNFVFASSSAAYGDTGLSTFSSSEKNVDVDPPYTLDDEANTKFLTPNLWANSMRSVVPRMLEWMYTKGSWIEGRTPALAAIWHTHSGFSISNTFVIKFSSQISPL